MFAEVVRVNRQRLGLTQEELAASAGLGIRTIRKIEAGRVGTPRPATIRLLADAFGLVGADREGFCQTAAGEPTHQPGSNGRAPAQLPADVSAFTGRAEQLAYLDALLAEAGDQPNAVIISAVSGTAGVGKTALAAHWAHRVANRYPDGQMFIDLHGFTNAVPPVEPGDALDRMLRALGVPGERIPVDLADRTALWRSVLAGRRMLIVLDNAATEAQVAPLLPGAHGCLVLVTSRCQLAGLDATHTVSLDMLPLVDAVTLFARSAGQDGLAIRSRAQVIEVVELCGRLPLAVRIAAARLRSHPVWSVTNLVERLRDEGERLGELEERTRGVATALDVSHRQLTAEQQRMYRLLGLHPGSDIEPYAAAALADTGLAVARRCLDQLLDAHLLQEPVPGRFVLHDLIRLHAASLAADRETEAQRRAALERLLDYYRCVASVAMDAAYPSEGTLRPRVPRARTPAPDLSEPSQATSWLDHELADLLAAARHAADHGWPAHLCHLSATVQQHLRTRGHYRDAEDVHRRALACARAAHRRADELAALTCLAHVEGLQGRNEQAAYHYDQAQEIARAIGDRTGEVEALTGLGKMHRMEGRYDQALVAFGRALKIARSVRYRLGEVEALIGLGNIDRLQGRYESALTRLEQALELARSTGIQTGTLSALTALGALYGQQGRHRPALEHLEQAWEMARSTGNHTAALLALLGTGHCHVRQRRYGPATDRYRQARDLARSIGHRTGELDALIGLGHTHRLRRRYDQAVAAYQHGLTNALEIGNRNWQFEALQSLGRLHYETGCPEAALSHHEQALEIAKDVGLPADLARTHDGLAHAYHLLRQPAQARTHWRTALDLLSRLGSDHTEDLETSAPAIRAHLALLDQEAIMTRTPYAG